MSNDQLKSLRNSIDTIDVEIQHLLTQRAEISLEVKKVKPDGDIKLKPGREAQILRALIERHKGHFPKTGIVQVWREIFSASLQAQGTFSLAVYSPEDGEMDGWGYIASTRGHFGVHTPMTSHSSKHRVIEAILEDECSVGILPVPSRHEDSPWWRHLAVQGNTKKDGTPSKPARIIAKLPFAVKKSDRTATKGEPLDCLVIAKSNADPSGLDSTYVVLDFSRNTTTTQIEARLIKSGMTGSVVNIWHDSQAPERWLCLICIDSYVLATDAKLDRLTDGISENLNHATILGSYAVPFSADMLASEDI